MSLYDNYRQTNSQYTSQYVGSIQPELEKFSDTMNQRYNTAADQDDQLTEALGNLQHLNFDQDTQYANELKKEYYQKLMDRSGRGDFENMGRRTRRDAIQFTNAYAPLIQRQKDFGDIIKKVNSDANISDPEKKVQILAYIQHMNSSSRRTDTGEYERDGSGRVNLGSIQDWAYAKDVDVNKKLADILSKKEADIKQSGFTSDGNGLKISSVDELRSSRVMASLARQMMSSDPEIKAMLNRDVTLQNYRLTPDQVTQSLSGSDISTYQAAKRKGLNDHQIAVLAKHEGVSVDDLKVSNLQRMRYAKMQQGMSASAADRAILNEQTYNQLAEPHAQFLGNLLSVDKHKIEAREDVAYAARLKHQLDQQDTSGNFQVLNTGPQTVAEIDPGQVTTNYAQQAANVRTIRTNTQAAILSGMKAAGMSSGDMKHDMATAFELSNNPLKLNELKARLSRSNPDLAGRLEVLQKTYQDAKNNLGYHEANAKALEQAGNVNVDKLYDQYKNGQLKSGTRAYDADSKILSKDDFIDALRNQNSGNRSWLKNMWNHNTSLFEAQRQYDEGVKAGATKVRDGRTQLNSYNPIQPMSAGYVKQATDAVSNAAKTGQLKLTDLGTGKEGTLADILGLKAAKLNDKTSDEYKAMDGAEVYINRNTNNGQRTLTIQRPDGTTKVVAISGGVDPALFKEFDSRTLVHATTMTNSDYARSLAADALTSQGEGTMHVTAQDLKGISPGSVNHPINDRYTVRVRQGGPNGKLYELKMRDTGEKVKTFESADGLVQALGYDENQRTKPAPKYSK